MRRKYLIACPFLRQRKMRKSLLLFCFTLLLSCIIFSPKAYAWSAMPPEWGDNFFYEQLPQTYSQNILTTYITVQANEEVELDISPDKEEGNGYLYIWMTGGEVRFGGYSGDMVVGNYANNVEYKFDFWFDTNNSTAKFRINDGEWSALLENAMPTPLEWMVLYSTSLDTGVVRTYAIASADPLPSLVPHYSILPEGTYKTSPVTVTATIPSGYLSDPNSICWGVMAYGDSSNWVSNTVMPSQLSGVFTLTLPPDNTHVSDLAFVEADDCCNSTSCNWTDHGGLGQSFSTVSNAYRYPVQLYDCFLQENGEIRYFALETPCTTGWNTVSYSWDFGEPVNPVKMVIDHNVWDGVQIYHADNLPMIANGESTNVSSTDHYNITEVGNVATIVWEDSVPFRYYMVSTGDASRTFNSVRFYTTKASDSSPIVLNSQSYHGNNALEEGNIAIAGITRDTSKAIGTVVPVGIGVMATTVLLFKALAWFKNIAGLKK